MRDTITTLKKIDGQISELKKILSKQSYFGAGITFSLNIGAHEDGENFDLNNMGVGDPVQCRKILESILGGLSDSREMYLLFLKKDLDSAADYLNYKIVKE